MEPPSRWWTKQAAAEQEVDPLLEGATAIIFCVELSVLGHQAWPVETNQAW